MSVPAHAHSRRIGRSELTVLVYVLCGSRQMSPESTGRFNRLIDRRSDLYSLGMILFELLCGRPAFTCTSIDPLDIIHAHVARPVRFAPLLDGTEPREGAPLQLLQQCILKLLSKSVEDRYHGARGVACDLRHCLRLLQSGQIDHGFRLGQLDQHGLFVVSQKLYGRDREIVQLLDAYHRLVHPDRDGPQLLLVAGFSGVGKTALVNEVHRPMVAQRGLFVKAKFDLYKRSSSVVFDALGSLLTHILAAGTGHEWATAIQSAVSPHGQLLVDVLPALKHVIGVQPATPAGSTFAEVQAAFMRTLLSFVAVFAQAQHPLVLFLGQKHRLGRGCAGCSCTRRASLRPRMVGVCCCR